VTSAWHMPRAMSVFKKAGWTPQAYPVDYMTALSFRWRPDFALLANFTMTQMAIHEYIGWAAYYFTGKSASLLP